MRESQIIGSDEALWTDFISGDREAFRAIYEKYFPELFKYGSYFSDDEDLVKDCIQDLFVNLHHYRSKLSLTTKIRPYLIASFKQNIFNKLRSIAEGRKKLISIDTLAFDYSFVADANEGSDDDRFSLLEKAMTDLTPRQREAVYLKYVTGLSYEELSAAMNLSYQASRNLIHHAMERLRTAITKRVLSLWAMICKI